MYQIIDHLCKAGNYTGFYFEKHLNDTYWIDFGYPWIFR